MQSSFEQQQLPKTALLRAHDVSWFVHMYFALTQKAVVFLFCDLILIRGSTLLSPDGTLMGVAARFDKKKKAEINSLSNSVVA